MPASLCILPDFYIEQYLSRQNKTELENFRLLQDFQIIQLLSYLQDKYIIVPVYKALNKIVFICKHHYFDCLIKELGIDNTLGNPTNTSTIKEILENKSILSSAWYLGQR